MLLFIPGKDINISSTLMQCVIYEGLEGMLTENLFIFLLRSAKPTHPAAHPTNLS